MKLRRYTFLIPFLCTTALLVLGNKIFSTDFAIASSGVQNLNINLTYSGPNSEGLNGISSFDNGSPFGTGTDDTFSLALGDLNQDGALDIVVGNDQQQSMIYLNDGTGNFSVSSNFGSGSDRTWSVVVGDMDGDGDLDIVTGNYGEQNVVYLNDSEGNFSVPRNFGTGSDATTSVALGDMDGDSDLDIVTGNDNQLSVVYLNSGTGYFSAGQNFGNHAIRSVALGDMDGDEDLDIVTGNYQQQDIVYLNDGTGGFPTSNTVGIFIHPTNSVAVGDMDNDGDLDIVAGYYEQENIVYLNDGTGEFTGGNFGLDSSSTKSLALGDMDADGDLDIVVGNDEQQNVVYKNNGPGNIAVGQGFGTGTNQTYVVFLGDMNGDAILDILAGNYQEQNLIYKNDIAPLTTSYVWSSFLLDSGQSVAWGDYDVDGDLDLATTSDGFQSIKLYRNEDGILTDSAVWSSSGNDDTRSIAWGDYDGDGDLDLAAGNLGSIRLYRNDNGILTDSAVWSSSESNDTRSIAWGDYDGDGDLDLAAGNLGSIRLYRNEDGILTDSAVWSSSGNYDTRSIAWGDYDGDGDLDLAAGNLGPIQLYRNDNGILTDSAVWSSSESNDARSVAWGDYDGDGDLDLGVGNTGLGPSIQLYRNNKGTLTASAVWSSTETYDTYSIAWGDCDGDGDLDLAAGNSEVASIYKNENGNLTINAVWSSNDYNNIHSVAWGDYDRDGDLDLAISNASSLFLTLLYRNTRNYLTLPGSIQTVSFSHPFANANFYSSPKIFIGTIPITYTITDPQGDSVAYIKAEYSLNGGGQWFPALATTNTITTHLTTTATYTFYWDTFASGFFGQSDNVVFRIEAVPEVSNQPNQIPGPYLYGRYASSTFPFRVRGSQVRVFTDTVSSQNVISGAIVYRLPAGQTENGKVYANGNGVPFRTNSQGYLQGAGNLFPGDRLIAMVPVTTTEVYTLYHTSAPPTFSGLNMYTVTQPGAQNLIISSQNPLFLFNLDVSLEWDAREDDVFLAQLTGYFQEASRLLFDWTNGQAALGQVHVYQNKEHWNDADIRFFATNNLRPSAAIGGWVPDILTETVSLSTTQVITYAPGQVHIGLIWNSFGDPTNNIGDDWPRVLAHELGHYLFFLDDNYLGLDANGTLISVDTCPGVMSNPYLDDDINGYDEFHPTTDWLNGCENTLSNLITGRSDWATITNFFPTVSSPQVSSFPEDNFFGPNELPLATTQSFFVDPSAPHSVLDSPIFELVNLDGSQYYSSNQAHAFLFHGDQLVDLGRPYLNQVNAPGATEGDRLCIYDAVKETQGCEILSSLDRELIMVSVDNWHPIVRVAPISADSTFITVTAQDVTSPIIYARLYPLDSNALLTTTLTMVSPGVYGGGYMGLINPVFEGYVVIWVDELEPRREIIIDFSIGSTPGNPGPRRSGGSGLSPVESLDGQLSIIGQGLNFGEDEFYSLQSTTFLPQNPPLMTAISKGYYLSTSENAPPLDNTFLHFGYIDTASQLIGDHIRIYYWNGINWISLETEVNSEQKIAIAPTMGQGLYVLMYSFNLYLPIILH